MNKYLIKTPYFTDADDKWYCVGCKKPININDDFWSPENQDSLSALNPDGTYCLCDSCYHKMKAQHIPFRIPGQRGGVHRNLFLFNMQSPKKPLHATHPSTLAHNLPRDQDRIARENLRTQRAPTQAEIDAYNESIGYINDW